MRAPLGQVIADAAHLARDAGIDEIAARAEELAHRLEGGRVHLAVLGQFKRGKSTILNALLGEPVLPSSVVPLTALPTLLKPGPRRRLEVAFVDGRPPEVAEAETGEELQARLSMYVTESANPANVLNVAHVDVYHPAPLLASGIVLIDTPGIGSTFRHNTEATLNFLPQCDAALFVVSADPPMTEVEAEFLAKVAERVPRLFFVLNKADYLDAGERAEALEFLSQVLGEHLSGGVPEVLCISAKRGLEARSRGADDEWRESGCAELEQALQRFADEEVHAVLAAAVKLRLDALLSEIGSQLALQRRLASMPLEEIDQRAELFRQAVEAATRQRQTAQDLLAGDRRRLLERLEAEAAAARERVSGALRDALARRQSDERIEDVLEREIPILFEHELGVVTEAVRSLSEQALNDHQARANELVKTVREAASGVFGVQLAAPQASEAFEMKREPYWVQHAWQLSLHVPPPSHLEALLPAGLRERRERAREQTAIDQVVVNNIENLRWALYQNLNDMFLIYGARLDRMLAEATEAIERALFEARSTSVEQRVTLEDRLAELDSLQARLDALMHSAEDALRA